MKFTPKPYEDLVGILEKGEVDFEITKFQEKDSKSGKPMMEFGIKLIDSKGKTNRINRFIMKDREMDQILLDLYYITHAAGKSELYQEGNVDERIVGGKGRCVIDSLPDQNGKLQNVIKYFIVPKDVKAKSAVEVKKQDTVMVDDDIGF